MVVLFQIIALIIGLYGVYEVIKLHIFMVKNSSINDRITMDIKKMETSMLQFNKKLVELKKLKELF